MNKIELLFNFFMLTKNTKGDLHQLIENEHIISWNAAKTKIQF